MAPRSNKNAAKKKIAHLRRRDPVLGGFIKKIKLEARSPREDYFRSLIISITNQQLSGKAAATIFNRLVPLFPGKDFPSPKQVLKMPVRKMRKAGYSRMKVMFIKDLARKAISGSVDLKNIGDLSDEEVIEHLTRVKGIGRWTAEMFLMFSLDREDIFSYGDLGLQNAIQKMYKLKKRPTLKQAEKISEKWKPYRSLASRYLWASLDLE